MNGYLDKKHFNPLENPSNSTNEFEYDPTDHTRSSTKKSLKMVILLRLLKGLSLSLVLLIP